MRSPMLRQPEGDSTPSVPFDIERMLAGQLSASSIAMYKRDVRAYQAFCESHRLSPLSALTLTSWRDGLVMHATLSPNTINSMLASVKRVVIAAAARHLSYTHVCTDCHQ